MKTSMHFIVFVIVIIIAGFYLPLYWMLILSGIVAFLFKITSGKAFIFGFVAGNLVWLGLAYYYHVTSLTSLTGMIGEIFQGLSVSSLTYITGLIGGISAGLGAWSGAALRDLFLAIKR